MKNLFIPSILNDDWNQFNTFLTVLAVLFACVFVSVLIDLFFGVMRAKRLNIVRISTNILQIIFSTVETGRALSLQIV